MKWGFLWFSCLVALAGCLDGFLAERPESADTDQLRSAYTAPSVPLTEDNVDEVLGSLEVRTDLASVFCGWPSALEVDSTCPGVDPLVRAIDALTPDGFLQSIPDPLAPDEPRELDLRGARVTGAGFARLTHICGGWDRAADPDPDNGRAVMLVGFTQRGLDPVIAGDFEQCKLGVPGLRSRVDGELRAFAIRRAKVLSLGFSFEGAAEALDETSEISIDFEFIAADGGVGIRLPVGDGGNVVFFASSRGLGFRAQNGEWLCDFEKRECIDENDQRLSLPSL